jgi:hypothetical protein
MAAMPLRKFILCLLILTVTLTLVISANAAPGQALYERKCGRCHTLFAPDDYSRAEWPSLLRSMKAQAMLRESEIETLSDYLLAGASGDSGTNDAPQIGGYLYTEYFRTDQKTTNFDLHYLALHISGWLSDDIAYLAEFELEHGGKGDNTFVEQAYIDYWFLPNLALKIGGILTPFNRFDEYHEPLLNRLITRPQMSRELGVSAWKDVGVNLHGHILLAERASTSFDLYTINGLGSGSNLRSSRQYRDNNEERAYGARLNLLLSDRLELGGSYYSGAWDDDGDHNLTLLGAHVLITVPQLELHAEYSDANSENPGTLAEGEMSGWFVQVSRKVGSRVRATLRYGALDYLDLGDALGRDPAKGDKDLTEFALGINFKPVRDLVFKAEYTIFDEVDRSVEVDNNQFALQAALNF